MMAGLVGQIQKVPDFPSRVSEASEAGEKFVEVFYDTFDKRRQVVLQCSNWSTSFLIVPKIISPNRRYLQSLPC